MADQTNLEPRRDYAANQLSRAQINDNPIEQFENWLQQARDAELLDATAMTLSTVDAQHRPHSRIVLLKAVSNEGFSFYTNYHSDKGQQLEANNHACLLFYWRELERQVRIEGHVTRLSADQAEEYFQSRPLGSRLSAAVSSQSRPVGSRLELESAVEKLSQQHPDGNIPRPPHWGGYRLQPDYYEFWQGRPDRLHDRFSFRPQGSRWQIDRLAP